MNFHNTNLETCHIATGYVDCYRRSPCLYAMQRLHSHAGAKGKFIL